MKLCLFTYLSNLSRNLHLGTIHLAHGLLKEQPHSQGSLLPALRGER